MKTKSIRPAREFGFAADYFNLSGEVLRQPESRPTAGEDSTLAVFVDHAAVNAAREILAGEMMLER